MLESEAPQYNPKTWPFKKYLVTDVVVFEGNCFFLYSEADED
jgi:hypothetical protein